MTENIPQRIEERDEIPFLIVPDEVIHFATYNKLRAIFFLRFACEAMERWDENNSDWTRKLVTFDDVQQTPLAGSRSIHTFTCEKRARHKPYYNL